MEFKKEELVKSPLNYTGGKYKLLPQILPLLPNDIDVFIDLFAGGCNVGINAKAKSIICNDIESHIITLLNYWKNVDSEHILKYIDDKIIEYNFSNTSKYGYEYYKCNSSDGVAKINKKSYIKLRDDYNADINNNDLFYMVLVFAFSNQIRFNSKGQFNMPVNKRDFNDNIRKNLIRFIDKIHTLNIEFTNKDFREFDMGNINNQGLVYCDPPYLVTCASYNEQDGWNETKEKELLDLLDGLNSRGVRFALSNVLENKGNSNDILKEWCKKYKVNHLNNTYGNCNYHAKDKSSNSTIEVLITNY